MEIFFYHHGTSLIRLCRRPRWGASLFAALDPANHRSIASPKSAHFLFGTGAGQRCWLARAQSGLG
jgi:hypothetical protein